MVKVIEYQPARTKLDLAAAVPHCALGAQTGASNGKGKSHDLRMIRNARRENAKVECLNKITNLNKELQGLRDQLSEWENWYHCHGGDNGITYLPVPSMLAKRCRMKLDSMISHYADCDKLRMDVHSGSLASYLAGSAKSKVHTHGNIASHVRMFSNPSLDVASEGELHSLQRGSRKARKTVKNGGDRFDVWALLQGMASTSSCIYNTGGSMAASHMTSPSNGFDRSLGDSLLNILLDHRARCESQVKNVIKSCLDDSWKLAIGYIVYIGEHDKPHRVFRIGYREYEREVWVARLHENINLRSTGFWVSTDRCYKLEPNDSVTVTDDIIAATEDKRLIPHGTKCNFKGWDQDGHVLLDFGGQSGRRIRTVVFQEELDKLCLE